MKQSSRKLNLSRDAVFDLIKRGKLNIGRDFLRLKGRIPY
jgi:hypothetical protein